MTMASVGRVGQALFRAQKAQKWTGLVVPARTKVFINRDWQPGPYPETEAERRAAAKKYNMVYEDYKPYPKDTMNMSEYPCGDYPKLEAFGEYSRDPHTNFENVAHKRNFGEPLHLQFEHFTSPRWDVSHKPYRPYWQQGLILLTVLTVHFSLFFICEIYDLRIILAKVPVKQQFPYQGETHYTFEPAE